MSKTSKQWVEEISQDSLMKKVSNVITFSEDY